MKNMEILDFGSHVCCLCVGASENCKVLFSSPLAAAETNPRMRMGGEGRYIRRMGRGREGKQLLPPTS
jgi:hypothetical protein